MSDRRHEHAGSARGGVHKDWKIWVAAVLMLAAIGIYVFTLDDSVEVRDEMAADAPAAPGAPTP